MNIKMIGQCINLCIPIGGIKRKNHDKVLDIGMVLGFILVIIGVLFIKQGVQL